MRLKPRLPQIDTTRPVELSPGFEHLDRSAMIVLRWLKENRVEFVLVGRVAEAVHAHKSSTGPAVIVPAPYRRNLDRLAKALNAADARVRNDRSPAPSSATPSSGRITADNLTGREVWTLFCGPHAIDVVGTAAPSAAGASGASGYQELLYEAHAFEPSPDLVIQVASPEDIEHYAHLRRTGTPPQIRITRRSSERQDRSVRAPTGARRPDSLPG